MNDYYGAVVDRGRGMQDRARSAPERTSAHKRILEPHVVTIHKTETGYYD
jgi:hypothetical protein